MTLKEAVNNIVFKTFEIGDKLTLNNSVGNIFKYELIGKNFSGCFDLTGSCSKSYNNGMPWRVTLSDLTELYKVRKEEESLQ